MDDRRLKDAARAATAAAEQMREAVEGERSDEARLVNAAATSIEKDALAVYATARMRP